jgi:hypothetical protein
MPRKADAPGRNFVTMNIVNKAFLRQPQRTERGNAHELLVSPQAAIYARKSKSVLSANKDGLE